MAHWSQQCDTGFEGEDVAHDVQIYSWQPSICSLQILRDNRAVASDGGGAVQAHDRSLFEAGLG